MTFFRTLAVYLIITAALIFTSAAHSTPIRVTEINDAILASPIFREYCHPALNELCFWQPEIFIIGYTKKKSLIATIQLTPENTESGNTVYQLNINGTNPNKRYNKRYEFSEDQPSPSNSAVTYSSIDVFWETQRIQIKKILARYGIRSNQFDKYEFTIEMPPLTHTKKIDAFIKSYECKSCTMPIITKAVLGYLKIDGTAFAVICFLEKGITAGPAVAHIELIGV